MNNSVFAKDAKRKYYKSSSFVMAVLFTVFAGFCSATLGYFMYAYGQGEYIGKDRVAITRGTYEAIKTFGVISIVLMSALVIISFLVSFFVVSRINIIGVTAKNIIDTGDLSRRISINTKWDDLSDLAQILNALLERTHNLMVDVRQVSDNIAHDLRTPLTRLANQLEDLREGVDASSQIKVEKIIAEAARIIETFNALLRISNIEKGNRHAKFEKVELDALLADVVELYEPLAEEKNISISKNIERREYLCDRNLIFQALANILDNAIKFTPAGGKINISLDNIGIVIADSGSGIQPSDKTKVFNRFYRAENSRTSEGNGLGLSLVAEVIKLHKAKIIMADNAPGLKVIITNL